MYRTAKPVLLKFISDGVNGLNDYKTKILRLRSAWIHWATFQAFRWYKL